MRESNAEVLRIDCAGCPVGPAGPDCADCVVTVLLDLQVGAGMAPPPTCDQEHRPRVARRNCQ